MFRQGMSSEFEVDALTLTALAEGHDYLY